MDKNAQMDLFACVTAAYTQAPNTQLDNATLYARVAEHMGVDGSTRSARVPVGKQGEKHNLFHRKIRWAQQTLRQMNVLQRHADEKGVWSLSEAFKAERGEDLNVARRGVMLVAFSTSLGTSIWGNNLDVTAGIDEPITLVVTSPPYFLQTARAYGNPKVEQEYIDFICRSIEPLLPKLAIGASLVINLGNGCFEPGSPARSIYYHRLVVALHDRYGLKLMDTIPWHGSKPPGRPTWWVSKKHVQLSSAYECILWVCADPAHVRADNQAVLEPHTAKHKRFVAAGGSRRHAVYGDGAYVTAPGDFSRPTPGKIPSNILMRGNRCADTLQYRQDAADLNLPIHGAMMPLSVATFFVKFLSKPGDLVYDLFSGTGKTAMASELLGRRWIAAEHALEYARATAERFRSRPGFEMSAAFSAVRG
jgi:DNA modification methylase